MQLKHAYHCAFSEVFKTTDYWPISKHWPIPEHLSTRTNPPMSSSPMNRLPKIDPPVRVRLNNHYQSKEQFYCLPTTNQIFFKWKFYVIFSYNSYSVFMNLLIWFILPSKRANCHFLIICNIIFILLQISFC